MPTLALAEEAAFVEDAVNLVWIAGRGSAKGTERSGRDILGVATNFALDFPGGEVATLELEAGDTTRRTRCGGL